MYLLKMNQMNYKKKSSSNINKRITKRFVNKFGILNGSKYLFSRISQNYLAFIPANKYINYFSDSTRIDS